MKRSVLTIILFFSCQFWHAFASSVLAIDYGTEWTKAALIKPGIPLEIVLTKDTRRKEQSAVAFKGNERIFGVDASNLATRFPAHSIRNVKELLDTAGLESVLVQKYQSSYPAIQLVENEETTSGISFVISDEENYSLEEIIAMTMEHYISLAEEMAHEKITDLVLTVPPHFNELQRSILLEAARILNKHVLALIDDNVAVAIEYSLSRSFSTDPTYNIIYDSGSGSTSATVISFDTVEGSSLGKKQNITRIRALASGFTLKLSGNEINRKLIGFMKNSFYQKHGIDLSHNHRALARLEKEALRVKHILSANSEAIASIEELADGIDFRLKITRSVLESLCKDMEDAAVEPINKALKKANLTFSEINSIILFGGASRIPFIQSTLADYVSSDKISKNVNADEASVKGAAFYGASLTKSFRVKPLIVQDIINYPYLLSLGTSEYVVALPDSTPYGMQHNVTIHNVSTIGKHPSFPLSNNGELIGEFTLSNITDVEKVCACSNKNIQISFSSDRTKGILVPLSAIMTCEHGELSSKHKLGDRVKSLFGSHDESGLRNNESYPIGFTYKKYGEMSDNALRLASAKLERRLQIDKSKAAHDNALNELETLLYRAQAMVDDDEFLEFANPEETKILKNDSVESYDWLIEYGSQSPTSEVTDRYKKLDDTLKSISFRFDQAKQFNTSLENFKNALERAESLLTNFDVPDYPLNVYDEKDVKRVNSLRGTSYKKLGNQYYNDTQWLKDNLDSHLSHTLSEDPLIKVEELEEKAKRLQELTYEYLRRSLQQPKLKAKKGASSSSTAESKVKDETFTNDIEPTTALNSTSTQETEKSRASVTQRPSSLQQEIDDSDEL